MTYSFTVHNFYAQTFGNLVGQGNVSLILFLDWFPRIRGIISVSNWQHISPDQQIWTDYCTPILIVKTHTAISLLCYVIIFSKIPNLLVVALI